MSNLTNVDSDEMAYESGYDKGYFEARSELSFKIKAILKDYLHGEVYTASEMATAIGIILDG